MDKEEPTYLNIDAKTHAQSAVSASRAQEPQHESNRKRVIPVRGSLRHVENAQYVLSVYTDFGDYESYFRPYDRLNEPSKSRLCQESPED
jgi:hypothetical protein